MLGCAVQTFRKVIGEGSIGRVHLGRWQETDVAIKVLGHVPPQTTMPTPAPMQSTGHMSAIAEADSEEPDVEGLADSSMAATIRTLEREVSCHAATKQNTMCTSWTRVHSLCWQICYTASMQLSPLPRSVPLACTFHPLATQQHAVAQYQPACIEYSQTCTVLHDTIAQPAVGMQVSILSAIRHPNVVLFMGVCLDPPCMVTEVSPAALRCQ